MLLLLFGCAVYTRDEFPEPPIAPLPESTPGPSEAQRSVSEAKQEAGSGSAPLVVSLLGAEHHTQGLEVDCPSGFRERTPLSAGQGRFAYVPKEDCTLWFKGGVPAQYGPVRGGQTLDCEIVGTTAVCVAR